jgi:enoyl-[acyl-carrier-protein] reductase (NADH)
MRTHAPPAPASIAKTTPLGRFASCEAMADTLCYLPSNAASNITGHVMFSNGGYPM